MRGGPLGTQAHEEALQVREGIEISEPSKGRSSQEAAGVRGEALPPLCSAELQPQEDAAGPAPSLRKPQAPPPH